MSGPPTRCVLVAASLALAAVGCGSRAHPTSPASSFSPLPSVTLPATLPPTLASALCTHIAAIQQALKGLEATPGQDAAQVSAGLGQLAADLRDDASKLQGAGQGQIATIALNAASAVQALQGSIPTSGTIPPSLESAIGIVSGSLQELPAGICSPD